MNEVSERPQYRDLAVRIAQSVSPVERAALGSWAAGLLDIRASNEPAVAKARSALTTTMDSRLIWPVLRNVAKEGRRLGWNDRSPAARLGLAGAAAGIVLFGASTAGIAALGTAIGVPLWVVFGGGVAFARVLREELDRHGPPIEGRASYTVIEADKVP